MQDTNVVTEIRLGMDGLLTVAKIDARSTSGGLPTPFAFRSTPRPMGGLRSDGYVVPRERERGAKGTKPHDLEKITQLKAQIARWSDVRANVRGAVVLLVIQSDL